MNISHTATADTTPDEISSERVSLATHLNELRKRLLMSSVLFLISFVGCYLYASDIYKFLVQPLADIFGDDQRRLIYTGLTEVFFTYLKVAFFGAFVLSFPFIASQCYLFMAPGLYKKERKLILPYLALCPILFAVGAALVYYFIFPLAWKFFLSFENLGTTEILPIVLEARVSEYLSLVMRLITAFGLAFQLPVILLLLAKAELINADSLRRFRKFAIIGVFTMAAILTPPDIISQIGLAVPMLVLYEVTILLMGRRKP